MRPPTPARLTLRDFGPREFTLVLLRRMEDFQPELVEDAAVLLGADRAELRAVHRWWQAAIRSRRLPAGTRRAGLVLGRPEHDERMPYGDLTVLVRQWQLPLWPDLRWQIVAAPTGTVLQEALVRAPGVRRPDLLDVSSLQPWSCTADDIAAAHPGATHHDDGVQSRWTVIARAADGRDRRLTFAWGLLQLVSNPTTDT